MLRYVEFAVASNFSFLRGASHPEELMLQAAHLGLAGIGLCDRNSVAGVVRAHLIKREQKLTLRLSSRRAARVRRRHARHPRLSARPSRAGAGSAACSPRGNLRAEKGECILCLDDLLEHIDGLELIVMESSTWDLQRCLAAQEIASQTIRSAPKASSEVAAKANRRRAPRWRASERPCGHL